MVPFFFFPLSIHVASAGGDLGEYRRKFLEAATTFRARYPERIFDTTTANVGRHLIALIAAFISSPFLYLYSFRSRPLISHPNDADVIGRCLSSSRRPGYSRPASLLCLLSFALVPRLLWRLCSLPSSGTRGRNAHGKTM